jgi:hypothetical protein
MATDLCAAFVTVRRRDVRSVYFPECKGNKLRISRNFETLISDPSIQYDDVSSVSVSQQIIAKTSTPELGVKKVKLSLYSPSKRIGF